MARSFSGNSALYRNTNPPVTAPPLTMSLWAKPGVDNRFVFSMQANPTTAANSISIKPSATSTAIATAGGATASSPTGTDRGWNHYCAAMLSAVDQAVYFNGAVSYTDLDCTSTAWVTTSIGALWHTSALTSPYTGDVSDVAVWNVALTDAEVMALARGISPLFIRPFALQAYWPLELIAAAGMNRARNTTDRSLTGLSGTSPGQANGPLIGARYYFNRSIGWRGNSAISAVDLVVSSLAIGNLAIDTPALGQKHVLGATSLETSPLAIGTPALALRFDLGASNLTITQPVTGTPALGHGYNLAATSLAIGGPAIGSPAVSAGSPPIEIGSPVIGTPTLGQRHVLGAVSPGLSSPVLPTPTIAQKHVLGALGTTTGSPQIAIVIPGLQPASLSIGSPTLGTPALGQTHVFNTTGLTLGTLLFASPTIGQKHALKVSSLAISGPALGLASLLQKFNLAALGTTISGPQITSPVFSKGTFFQVVSLTVGRPVLGSPVLHQRQILSALGVTIGPPDIGSPRESMIYALSPLGVSISALQIGFSPFTIVRALTAKNVEVGSPTADWQAPFVYHKMADIISPHTEAPIKKALFTNTNDEHALKVAAKSLVGNSLDIKADAEKISVKNPLTLLAGILGIDLSELEAAIAQLQALHGIETTTRTNQVIDINVNIASLVSSVASINNSLLQVNGNINKLYNVVSVGKGALNLAIGSPVFGTPQIKQVHKFQSAPMVLSSPVIGQPVIVRH